MAGRDDENDDKEREEGKADTDPDQQSPRERAAAGAWLGDLDRFIKENQVDDNRPQSVTREETAAGFHRTLIPHYGMSHYGLTPAQAAAVAVTLEDGGHIVKESGLREGQVYYAHWPSSDARRPIWTGDSLEQVIERLRRR